MGQTRGQLKITIRQNLDDDVASFYSDTDLNESLQDAYDDIASLTQCITSIADNLVWVPNLVYYDPRVDLGMIDYLGMVAIFNYSTNRWLRDDLSIRDFDRIQRNWECWTGTPQFWAPSDPYHFAIAPNYPGTLSGGAFNQVDFSSSYDVVVNSLNPVGALATTFKLVYYSQAPKLTSDSSTFKIASDMQTLLEFYSTADLLEQSQEFVKASEYWEKYYESIENYADRVKRANKADLLMRV